MDDLKALEPWLVLQKIPAFSLNTCHRLLEHFHSPEIILDAQAEVLELLSDLQKQELLAFNAAESAHPVWQLVKREIDYLDKSRNNKNHLIKVITYHSELYPPALKQTHNAPLMLYVRGNAELLSTMQLAVVGARRSGKAARDIAFQWSSDLAATGLGITSGLALGIDGAAHAGALSVKGNTIAVLGHGIDQLYPPQHKKLAEEIIESGALVSEFPLGSVPRKDHFPRRNRIISGLSLGVLVVEAAIKSGSLITARYALEQNRDVFAVPGAINNVMAQGCHQLIKDGAYLVESAADILHAMTWQTNKQPSLFNDTNDLPQQKKTTKKAPTENRQKNEKHNDNEVMKDLNQQAKKILQAIPYYLIHIDTLMENTGLGLNELTSELIMLEVDGFIEMVAGNYQRVK